MAGVDNSDELFRPFTVSKDPGRMPELSSVSVWALMDESIVGLKLVSRFFSK